MVTNPDDLLGRYVEAGCELVIVHADGPEVLEVDLGTGETRLHLFETTSWWDRLLASWMPTAAAKGPQLGTYSSVALSPDGRYLLVSGNRELVETGEDGTVTERSDHLGLTVVDTKTWKIIAAPDVPIQFIYPAGGVVVGVDTTSFQPWVDNLWLLSVSESGAVTSQGPFTVTNGGCDVRSDFGHLICFENGHVRIIDIETHETLVRPAIGLGDRVHSNDVLEDWLPTTQN